jgi:putative DNA primase/helicase
VTAPSNRQIVAGPGDPAASIDHYLKNLYDHEERCTLIFHRNIFWSWNSQNWEPVAADFLESSVSFYFRYCDYWKAGTGNNGPTQVPFPVNNNSLANLMRALRNVVIVDEKTELNSWLYRLPGDPDPQDIVPVQNGLLNTVNRELMEPTPRFFNPYSLSFEYEPFAIPREIYAFMDSVFALDSERRDLLQEMIGYLLTTSRRYQVMFWLIGPTRSGKGTIGRLIDKLVGSENFGGTSMATLSTDHGLEGIVSKPVVQLGDVVSMGRNSGIALERLLSIIGNDKIEVNPKGKAVYSATLPCRFILLANKTPILPDTAQALRARTILLRFYESFIGREDRDLDEKLASELPGILNWALDGLDRLRDRGLFLQPQAGVEDLDLNTRIVAPAAGFIEDCCVVGPYVAGDGWDQAIFEPTENMWLAWQNWCAENGANPRAKAWMVRLINEAPTGKDVKSGKSPRKDGRQWNCLQGIRLTPEARQKYVFLPDNYWHGRSMGGGGWPD